MTLFLTGKLFVVFVLLCDDYKYWLNHNKLCVFLWEGMSCPDFKPRLLMYVPSTGFMDASCNRRFATELQWFHAHKGFYHDHVIMSCLMSPCIGADFSPLYFYFLFFKENWNNWPWVKTKWVKTDEFSRGNPFEH